MKIDLQEEFELKKYIPSSTHLKSLSTFFYLFSDDTRLKIIILLIIKPLCVGDISSVLSANQTTISHQLKILKAQNIVGCDRCGKKIVYYIKNNNIEPMLNASVECL